MNRSICPICNSFYEDAAPLNRMCTDCHNHKVNAIDYIKTHNNVSIAEITLTTGIPIKILKKLIENSYITFSNH